MPDSTIAADFAFDRCVIRREARQVLIDGQPVRLGARAFDLLLVLIEQRDRVVSKNELLETVWPGLVIEENNLQVHVSSLRKLLGPATIATIPGRGYRFTATPPPPLLTRGTDDTLHATPARRSTDRPIDEPILFGRDQDFRAVTGLVTAHRLVTLAGAGGIGKTVLAHAVARAIKSAFTHGVCVVDLAPLTDTTQLAAVVAGALQVTLGHGEVSTALAEAVKARHMLIVLDNCEHLVQSVALLAATLLHAAPMLHLLATSQEPLKLQHEQIYRVGTLAVPARVTLEAAKAAGAVRLFEHRAHAVDQHFVLDESNVAAVVDICVQLDGIALAIELAAARVQLLGVQGLRDRLGQRLFVLSGGSRVAPPRQRTLRAALEWSHTLLSMDQQAVFRRLGVMSGSFGLDASQQVAAIGTIDKWAVLDHLGALVEKSLISVEADTDGVMRYRMLETMRQFALERLAESGEQHVTRERHLACFLALALEAKAQLEGPTQGAWLKRLDRDRDNLFAAHAWCNHADDGAVRGLRLVSALPRFWLSRGLLVQGHHACLEALARVHAGDNDRKHAEGDDCKHPEGDDHAIAEEYNRLRCEGLLHAGRLCGYRGLDHESATLLGESILSARQGGFTDLLSNALSHLGFVRLSLLDRTGARVLLEEALMLARQSGNAAVLISLAATSLAEVERIEGNLQAAEALYEEGLHHVRATGDRLRTMIGLNNLAMVAIAAGSGDDRRARMMLIESLAISDELGSRRGRLVVMEVCAGLAAHLGQWELVARFDGAADIHTVQMGRRRDIADAAFLAPLIECARVALGREGYASTEAAGRALSYDNAVAAMQEWLEMPANTGVLPLNLETAVGRGEAGI